MERWVNENFASAFQKAPVHTCSRTQMLKNSENIKNKLCRSCCPGMFYKKKCSKEFCKIHRKAFVSEFPFNKAAGPQSVILLKKETSRQIISYGFPKIFKNANFVDIFFFKSTNFVCILFDCSDNFESFLNEHQFGRTLLFSRTPILYTSFLNAQITDHPSDYLIQLDRHII